MISNPASRASLLRADVTETSKTGRVGRVIDRSASDHSTKPPWLAHAPENYRQTLHVVRNAGQFRPWETTRWHDRRHDYDELKQAFTERLLAKLYEHVSQARSRVKHAELGTPLSTRHFANHASGETYGLAHSPERFSLRALRPQTPIRGLYLTGVDVALCGIAGALASGYLTASAVLQKNAMTAASKA